MIFFRTIDSIRHVVSPLQNNVIRRIHLLAAFVSFVIYRERIDVGVDNWNFSPVSYNEIKEYLNTNYKGK